MRSPARLTTAAVLCAGLALALCACGKQAELQRPSPLFGKPRQPSSAELGRDEAAARARADGAARSDAAAPQSVDEVRDQGLRGHPSDGPAAQASDAPPSPETTPQ